MTKKILAPVLGVVLLGIVLTAPQARALTLIPPSLEFSAKPGETIDTKVKLFNETAEVVMQYSSTANFKAKDETGTPAFIDEPTTTDLASWITLEPGPFTLQPGERLEIPATISVPATAEPGGHYAAIFFSSRAPEQTEQTSQIGISTKLGTLILVRVDGVIRESGKVTTFTTADVKTFFSRPPVSFVLKMQNDGNVHFRPAGNVTIRNSIGGTTVELPVNIQQGAVLPASTRRFDIAWEKSANDAERGNFFQEIAAEWRNFAFGPYTANVNLTYGQTSDKLATAAFSFWVLPWRLLLVSIFILVFAIWLIVQFVKRYNVWIVNKAKAGK